MITVKDFLEKITNPDRIKIVKGEEVLFAGYKKDWKARGLMAPIEPEQAPDYKFSDLEMKLYYKICI